MKFSKVLIIVLIFLFFVTGSILGYNIGRNVERKEQLFGEEGESYLTISDKTVIMDSQPKKNIKQFL